MPAYVVDLLSPSVGDPGDSAATFTGGIALNAALPTQGSQSVVQAINETAAVQSALTGTITATVGGQSAGYTPGPSTIGTTSAQLPFVLVATATPGLYELWLEDLATMPGGTPDWDYDDRVWLIQVRPPGPPQGDLDIVDSNGAVVPEQQENNPGGYVAVNNDNDNYNFDPAASRFHKYDKEEIAQVEGENDLVKITVKDLAYQNNDPTTGNFTLTWASTKIKVWKSADKGAGAFASGTQVAPGAALDLWVEGLDVSATVGAESITLNWNPAGGTTTGMDSVDFTVYKVEGVMNVPGYSVHTYRITEPVTAMFGAGGAPTQTSTVTHGTEKTAANLYTGIFPGMTTAILTRTITVLWGEGAKQGIVRFGTAAAPNFFTDREVNIVKIEFDFAGATNKLTLQTNAVFQKATGEGTAPEIFSLDFSKPANQNKAAMQGSIVMKRMTGPMVGNSMRGLRFMQAGLIQTAKPTQVSGTFDFTPKQRQKANYANGTTYLDVAPAEDVLPWYSSVLPLGDPSLYTQETDQNTSVENKGLGIIDSPGLPGAQSATLTIDDVSRNLTRIDIQVLFDVYVAVRTRDTGLGSDAVYTQRGITDWEFNGSGTVTFHPATDTTLKKWVWEPITNVTGNKSTKTGFSEVTTGVAVPVTTGVTANTAARNVVWQVEAE